MAIPGYKILKKIGDGGMSSVYLAIQLSVGREVALKILSPELRSNPSFGDKFFREANIVGTLSHPNIVSIYDVGTEGEHYYIAMDYLPGESCAMRIKHGDISLPDCLKIVKHIASALDYAHQRGFIHCDVKPDNILFRHDGSAVLTDFGIATASSIASRGPGVDAVAGTPNYMSPEQTQGKAIDGRSDLYSLGIVFYEMLSGEAPFKGKDAVSVAIKHLTAEIPRLPAQYRVFQPVINNMLAKKPSARYQNGKEIIEALQALEGGLSREHALTSTEPTALQAFSLLEALIATFGHVTLSVIKRALSRFAVLGKLRFSRKQGLYLIESAVVEPIERNLNNNTQFGAATTHINTHTFGEDLGSALAQKHFKRLVSPWVIASGLLILLLCIALLAVDRKTAIQTVDSLLATLSVNQHKQASRQSSKPPEEAFHQPSVVDGNDLNLQATITPVVSVVETDGKVDSVDISSSESDAVAKIVEQNSRPDEKNEIKTPESLSYKLNIETDPPDAVVRILNIKPRYKSGILLESGNYHLKISATGFEPLRQWIAVRDQDLTLHFSLQKTKPVHQAGDIIQHAIGDNVTGPKMVIVAAGQFNMGNDATDSGASPAHTVTIPNPFAISLHEIRYADYDLFAKATGRELSPDFGNDRNTHPVSYISWRDASAYTQWLSQASGHHYRLPTEAEWEYAARADTNTDYWWTGDDARKKANCNSGCKSQWVKLFTSSSAPVGSFGQNPFGLFDTSGNVAEWVQDCYTNEYINTPKNGAAFEQADCKYRVIRGGSFKSSQHDIRNFSRNFDVPEKQDKAIGFRVILELQ